MYMKYNYTKKVSLSFSDAIQKTKETLTENGFGILTNIDVAVTLKNKLNIVYEPYLILGVCNPALAYKSLQAEKEIGLFLPCNVIIYEQKGDVFISVIRPTVAMGMVENEALATVAAQAEKKLLHAIESVHS